MTLYLLIWIRKKVGISLAVLSIVRYRPCKCIYTRVKFFCTKQIYTYTHSHPPTHTHTHTHTADLFERNARQRIEDMQELVVVDQERACLLRLHKLGQSLKILCCCLREGIERGQYTLRHETSGLGGIVGLELGCRRVILAWQLGERAALFVWIMQKKKKKKKKKDILGNQGRIYQQTFSWSNSIVFFLVDFSHRVDERVRCAECAVNDQPPVKHETCVCHSLTCVLGVKIRKTKDKTHTHTHTHTNMSTDWIEFYEKLTAKVSKSTAFSSKARNASQGTSNEPPFAFSKHADWRRSEC